MRRVDTRPTHSRPGEAGRPRLGLLLVLSPEPGSRAVDFHSLQSSCDSGPDLSALLCHHPRRPTGLWQWAQRTRRAQGLPGVQQEGGQQGLHFPSFPFWWPGGCTTAVCWPQGALALRNARHGHPKTRSHSFSHTTVCQVTPGSQPHAATHRHTRAVLHTYLHVHTLPQRTVLWSWVRQVVALPWTR